MRKISSKELKDVIYLGLSKVCPQDIDAVNTWKRICVGGQTTRYIMEYGFRIHKDIYFYFKPADNFLSLMIFGLNNWNEGKILETILDTKSGQIVLKEHDRQLSLEKWLDERMHVNGSIKVEL